MKKGYVISLVSLLFIIILGLFVFGGYGDSTLTYPENGTLVGNNYPYFVTNGTNFSSTHVSTSNLSYDHELIVNGSRYGITNCLNNTVCISSPNNTIPQGVNLTAYVNITNGTDFVNQTLMITFSYDTVNPFNNISGAYRGNATYFNAGSILAAFYINDTMLANYTLYLYNASSGARLHSYNRTHTTDANKTHNYTVQSWAETLNFSTTFYSGDAMDEDRYVYSLRSYDWYNNYNVSNVTIVLDRTFPLLTYYGWAESNNTVTNDTHDIVFNVTFTDTNFANATYTLLNTTSRLVIHSTNVTSSASTNVNFSGLPDGNYTFYMNVTDLATNQNITTRWKTVFLNATPLLEYGAATMANNTNFSTKNAYLNISLVEYNLVNITFKLTNVSSGLVLNTTIYNATNYSSYLMAVNYTNLSDGKYNVNVTARDTFNHINSTLYRSFIIDTTVPTSTASSSVASVARAGSLTLSCSATDNIDASTIVSLEVQAPSGSYVTLATGIGSISSAYSSTSTTGTYNVKCTGTDQSENTAINIATFSVADSSDSSSSSSSSGTGSGTTSTVAPVISKSPVKKPIRRAGEVEESLETNVDWTETGVTELTGIVGGEVYTFVTVADEESHTINIDSVDEATGTVVVTIQSEPQTITLTLESPIAEVDLNGDLTADMKITLVGITDGEATISVEKIDGLFEEPAIGLSAWAWVGIIVLVLGISAAIVYFVVKPQEKVVKKK